MQETVPISIPEWFKRNSLTRKQGYAIVKQHRLLPTQINGRSFLRDDRNLRRVEALIRPNACGYFPLFS
jgi:hypothetical protein